MRKILELLNVIAVFIKWVLLSHFYKYDERAWRFILENRYCSKIELWVIGLVGKVNGYKL